jgi:hypothetical protein
MFAKRVLLLAAASLSLVASTPSDEGVDGYRVRKVEGYTVFASNALEEKEPELAGEALALLRVKLFDVNRVVPERVLPELQRVPIWLELEGKDPCAVYHPSLEWLLEHGYRPEKARSVEIANARNFVRWTLDQPAMLVHELMHAYHHRVLGHDHAGIREAFAAAGASGAYASVLHFSGEEREAYALRDQQEYFAEICEAWFGTNDFYPFVRAELRRHDPRGYALLEELFR